MTGARILDWRPIRKGALLGFAKIALPSGMILNDVCVLSGDQGPWASPPAKQVIGSDGVARKDASGKSRYLPLVEFTDKATRDRFSASVIEALRASHPEAFDA